MTLMGIFYTVVLLGVLIFVHELGHFLVAKLLGVKVLKFSLGFGPKIIGKTYGETEYLISVVPFGGYVKMLGQEDMPSEQEEISEAEKHRAYNFQPVWKRFSIVFFGPLFNLLFALFVFIILYLTGIPVQFPDIGKMEKESPAVKAGFISGDRVLEINGKLIHDWEDINEEIDKVGSNPASFKLKRGSETIVLSVIPEKKIIKNLFGAEKEVYDFGISPFIQPVIGEIISGMPAQKNGLKIGDRIVEIDGKEIRMWEDMTEIIHASSGKSLKFKVERNNQIIEVSITPEKKAIPVSVKEEKFVGQIGVTFLKDDLRKSFSLQESIHMGLQQSWRYCQLTVIVLWKLIQRAIPASTVGGPILIAQMAGQQAAEGAVYFFSLMAALSINLGVINLFPMPILDGGHLMFIGIEAVRKKPLSEKVMLNAQKVGLVLIVTLIVFVTYNDIMRLITGKMLP